MKKIDSLTLVGLVAGLVVLILGMISNAGGKIFLNLSSFSITIGGSLCALLINYSLDEIKEIGRMFYVATKSSKVSFSDIIIQFTEMAKKARREGLLSLEDEINSMDDEFVKNGLKMVVDGVEVELIKELMELEIDEMSNRHIRRANIFKAWGGYSTAFGLIGTLIGLIQMLENFGDTNSFTNGMAKALITTFYGAVLAYLVFYPIASNLNNKNEKEIALREMMLEGILSIQSGVNPRILEQKLVSFLPPTEKLEYLKSTGEVKGAVFNG